MRHETRGGCGVCLHSFLRGAFRTFLCCCLRTETLKYAWRRARPGYGRVAAATEVNHAPTRFRSRPPARLHARVCCRVGNSDKIKAGFYGERTLSRKLIFCPLPRDICCSQAPGRHEPPRLLARRRRAPRQRAHRACPVTTPSLAEGTAPTSNPGLASGRLLLAVATTRTESRGVPRAAAPGRRARGSTGGHVPPRAVADPRATGGTAGRFEPVP